MRRLGVKFRAVRLFHPGYVARIFNRRALHSQANPKERHLVFARVLNCINHSLNAALPEAARLHGYDGILVPGGFGKRGLQGMIHPIQYAREHPVPFFGICLGMQCATIEYARDVTGMKQADSTEFDPQTPHRVIYKLRELLGVDEMGGTMRLGAWTCKLEPGSFAHKAYGKLEISERHRHRYEFNRDYEKTLVGEIGRAHV